MNLSTGYKKEVDKLFHYRMCLIFKGGLRNQQRG